LQAGVLTFDNFEGVHMCMRQPTVSAPSVDIPPLVQKFRKFTEPELGAVRTHYGKTYDPKDYQFVRHGVVLSNKNDVSSIEIIDFKKTKLFEIFLLFA
jgi:hypothetical protein